ncbi:Outer membrane efflux protein [compost metagenome]
MSRKVSTPILGAILSLAVGFGSTQAHALTLNEYLESVKNQNLSYKGTTQQSEGAELLSREADLFFTPQLFAEANVGHNGKPNTPQMYDRVRSQSYLLGVSQQFSFGLQSRLYYSMGRSEFVNASGAINPPQYWDASPQLELTMPLWGGGFGRTAQANQEATRQASLAEKWNTEGVSQNILIGAEATYWKVAAWQDVVRIQEQALTAAQNIYDYVSRKKRMNLGETADVVQAQALVEARTLELQIAKNESQEAQRTFNKYLNKDAYAPVAALEPVDYKALESITVPAARPGSRADVQATEAQLAAAKAQSALALERNRPTLNVVGQYALNGRDEELNEALKEAGQTEQDTAFIGLRFNMPLNFGATSDARSGALKKERAAEMNRDYALYAQEQDWTNLTRNITDARDNMKILSRLEQAQKTKLETERARLKQGRTTTYQVLLFEQDYSQAAVSKVKSAVNILALQSQLKLYQASPEGGK